MLQCLYTFIIYYFLLQLFHVNITVITSNGCTCSIAAINVIMISIITSTLSYAQPLSL